MPRPLRVRPRALRRDRRARRRVGGHAVDLRRDPLSGRLVVVAPRRRRRPGAGADLIPDPTDHELRDCPFCHGREDRTPPEAFRLGDDPWQVRVVPNLYPAFERDEVVIHSPQHVRTFAELPRSHIALVAEAWRQRQAVARAEGYAYVHAFINEGRSSGASLAHSHSQLVWLRDAPPAVRAEADARCRICDLFTAELSEPSRLVAERDGLAAICPAAGRVPYEALLAPAAHSGDAFGPALDSALDLLAGLVRALRTLEGPVPWNAWLHAGDHWHVELVPRLSTFAGTELGAGIYVLTVAPEDAASALRGALTGAGAAPGQASK